MKRGSCLTLIVILGLAVAFVYIWPDECRRLLFWFSFYRLRDLF